MLAALVLALAPTAPAPPPADASTARYRRCLARALERRHAFAEGIDLWVDHSRWENPWRVDSEHYSVRTTHSRALASTIAEGLETMQGHFRRILDTDYEPSQRFEVWVFPDLARYNEFGNQNGAEHSSILGAFYADQHAQRPIVSCYDANQTLLLMWLTHAATHQYVSAAFGREPATPWSEGLASYFSLYWDWSYGAREHRRLRAQGGGFVPLRQLLAEDLSAYLQRPHDRFMELGMLFDYLLHYREDTAIAEEGPQPEAAFVDFLRAVVRGRDGSETGFAVFLEYLDALESDFRAYDFPG